MQVGDPVTIVVKQAGKKLKPSFRRVVGDIISVTSKHFTIDNGKYRQCFLFKDQNKSFKIIPDNKEANEVALLTIEQARAALPKGTMEALLNTGKKNVEIYRDTGVSEQQFYQLKKEYGLTVLTKPGSKSIVPGNGAAKQETQTPEPPVDQKGIEPLAFDEGGMPPVTEMINAEKSQENEQKTEYPSDDKKVIQITEEEMAALALLAGEGIKNREETAVAMEEIKALREEMAKYDQLFEEQFKLYQEINTTLKVTIEELDARFIELFTGLKMQVKTLDLKVEELGKPVQAELRETECSCSGRADETEALREEMAYLKNTIDDLAAHIVNALLDKGAVTEELQKSKGRLTDFKDWVATKVEKIEARLLRLEEHAKHHSHQVQHGLFSSKAIS
ncbi:MAG: kinetochore Spc7 family protein [Bacillota bacterium]